MATIGKTHKNLYELARPIVADKTDANSTKQKPLEEISGAFLFKEA